MSTRLLIGLALVGMAAELVTRAIEGDAWLMLTGVIAAILWSVGGLAHLGVLWICVRRWSRGESV